MIYGRLEVQIVCGVGPGSSQRFGLMVDVQLRVGFGGDVQDSELRARSQI